MQHLGANSFRQGDFTLRGKRARESSVDRSHGPACPRKIAGYCVVVAGGVAGAAGSVVAGGVVAGCSVVVGAGAVASVGA